MIKFITHSILGMLQYIDFTIILFWKFEVIYSPIGITSTPYGLIIPKRTVYNNIEVERCLLAIKRECDSIPASCSAVTKYVLASDNELAVTCR